jgi:TolC family type I secretion outer membrane protein
MRRMALAAALAAAPLRAADPFDALTAVPPLSGLSPVPTSCRNAEPLAPLDLVALVDLALCNNPQTRQAWAAARLQAAQLGVAQATFLPSLTAGASLVRNRNEAAHGGAPYTQRSAQADLTWVLFDFGARAANLENARQLYLAAAFTRDATVQAVFLAAVQAYFKRQAAAAGLEAARLSERAALEALNAAEARYRVGTATPADRLQARTAHAQAVLNRIGAEGAVKTAQGALANVVGIEPTRPLELAPLPPAAAGPDFEADVARLIDEARARRPDLAAARAQVRAAEAGVDAAKAAHLPTLSLGVATGRNRIDGQAAFDNASFGLTLNIPLFGGFSTTYKVHAAQAQAEQQAARHEQLRQQVALEVWNAHANLVTATQSVKTAAQLLENALQSERVAAARYRAGVGSILDLLAAQAALAGARQSRIQADTDWFIARSALAYSMGALDADLLGSLAPSTAPPPSQAGKERSP